MGFLLYTQTNAATFGGEGSELFVLGHWCCLGFKHFQFGQFEHRINERGLLMVIVLSAWVWGHRMNRMYSWIARVGWIRRPGQGMNIVWALRVWMDGMDRMTHGMRGWG